MKWAAPCAAWRSAAARACFRDDLDEPFGFQALERLEDRGAADLQLLCERVSAVDGGPVFSPRTHPVKLYDETGRSVGVFARPADAWAALDALDASA